MARRSGRPRDPSCPAHPTCTCPKPVSLNDVLRSLGKPEAVDTPENHRRWMYELTAASNGDSIDLWKHYHQSDEVSQEDEDTNSKAKPKAKPAEVIPFKRLRRRKRKQENG